MTSSETDELDSAPLPVLHPLSPMARMRQQGVQGFWGAGIGTCLSTASNLLKSAHIISPSVDQIVTTVTGLLTMISYGVGIRCFMKAKGIGQKSWMAALFSIVVVIFVVLSFLYPLAGFGLLAVVVGFPVYLSTRPDAEPSKKAVKARDNATTEDGGAK